MLQTFQLSKFRENPEKRCHRRKSELKIADTERLVLPDKLGVTEDDPIMNLYHGDSSFFLSFFSFIFFYHTHPRHTHMAHAGTSGHFFTLRCCSLALEGISSERNEAGRREGRREFA
jgi:hypothetical protein